MIKKLMLAAMLLVGCSRDADVVSENLSYEADAFKILRRVVFYNGVTGEYILSIEGYCSLGGNGKELQVICKTGDMSYKKHFLGLSDNVTYFAEQIDSAGVSRHRYKVVFKPLSIIPSVDVE